MSGKIDYVRLLFALSPFPSYLPQYFSILRRLSPADGDDDRSAPAPGEVAAEAPDREGGLHLRKRNSCNSLQGISPGTVERKTFDPPGASQDGNGEGGADAGMSRATVLLLLSAHLLRLLYFHGLRLEQRTPAPPRGGTEPGGFVTPTSASIESAEPRRSALQWDLLGQSLSMITVQLMLLHAMMLLRRRRPKQERERTPDGGQDLPEPPPARPPRPGSNPPPAHPPRSGNNFGRGSRRAGFSRATSAHLRNLLSPHSILQKHSFLEYVELLFLCSMTAKLVFDVYFYPRYRMGTVLWLKHASIVLESCLALPQAIRNWRKGTTEGLSAMMVGGWVAGDFFKLCYFLLDTIGGGGDRGNNVFALGCLLALSLDSIVAFQMAWWYPTGPTLEWKRRIARSARHWSANKDDDAGESLLAQKKDGLFAPFLAAFFEWARGMR